ncbi:MAG: hypothetical protein ABSD20_16940 [Terriglobales bacterium]|jgi:hypothetical protein
MTPECTSALSAIEKRIAEGTVSAAFQPNLETNEDHKQEFTAESAPASDNGGSTNYAWESGGLSEPMAEDQSGWRIATPSPKLMAVQKPYDPYALLYSATPNAPRVILPEPTFGEGSFGEPTFVSIVSPANEIPEPEAPSKLRAYLVMAGVVVFAVVLIFGMAIAWNSRGLIAANLDAVRLRLHEMDSSKPNRMPQYTVTPVSKAVPAKRAAATAPLGTSSAPIGGETLPAAPAPRPRGPGTMRVRISGAPPTSNVVPVTIQETDASPASEPVR